MVRLVDQREPRGQVPAGRRHAVAGDADLRAQILGSACQLDGPRLGGVGSRAGPRQRGPVAYRAAGGPLAAWERRAAAYGSRRASDPPLPAGAGRGERSHAGRGTARSRAQ